MMYAVLPFFWTAFRSFLWEVLNLSFFNWAGIFVCLCSLFLGALKLIPRPRAM